MITSQTLNLNSVLSLWLFHSVSPLWLTCSFKHPLLDVSSNNYICWKSKIWILQGPWKWFMSKSMLSANPEPGANCNSLLEMTSYTPNNQQHTEHVPSPLYLPRVSTDTSVCVCVRQRKFLLLARSQCSCFFYWKHRRSICLPRATRAENNKMLWGRLVCGWSFRSQSRGVSPETQGFAGTAQSWLRSKALLIAGLLFNACSCCWHGLDASLSSHQHLYQTKHNVLQQKS